MTWHERAVHVAERCGFAGLQPRIVGLLIDEVELALFELETEIKTGQKAGQKEQDAKTDGAPKEGCDGVPGA